MLKTEALVMLLHLGRHAIKMCLLCFAFHFFFSFQPGNESIKRQYWIKKIKKQVFTAGKLLLIIKGFPPSFLWPLFFLEFLQYILDEEKYLGWDIDAILSTLHVLTQFVLTTTLWERSYYYHYPTETKAQRGEVIHLRSTGISGRDQMQIKVVLLQNQCTIHATLSPERQSKENPRLSFYIKPKNKIFSLCNNLTRSQGDITHFSTLVYKIMDPKFHYRNLHKIQRLFL